MDKIPGYDFEAHHMPIMHHDELCIAGDIFANPKAKTYQEIHKIKRKHITKESEWHVDDKDEFMQQAEREGNEGTYQKWDFGSENEDDNTMVDDPYGEGHMGDDINVHMNEDFKMGDDFEKEMNA